MTQVLRHFSLDAKLGLTDVQVNEVCCTITPSQCKYDLGSSVFAFHAICANAQLSNARLGMQARAIYGSNQLSPDKGESKAIEM